MKVKLSEIIDAIEMQMISMNTALWKISFLRK